MKLFKTEEHADVATVLNNMSFVYYAMGQLDKALEVTQRANSKESLELILFLFTFLILLDIMMKVFKTEEHLSVATTLSNMALFLSDSGERKKLLI